MGMVSVPCIVDNSNGFFFVLFFAEKNSGLFRFVSKQFCLFRLFRYRFETPKQTETDLVRFVSGRTEIFFC